MLAALGTVIFTSLSGVMAPGPMFAVTLAKSLKSPWAGVLVSLGHAVVEVPLILLVYFGLAQFFENEVVSLVLAILGGVLFMVFGLLFWPVRVLLRSLKKKKAGSEGAGSPGANREDSKGAGDDGQAGPCPGVTACKKKTFRARCRAYHRQCIGCKRA